MKANTYVVKPFGISEVKVIALKGDPGTPSQEQVNTAVDEYMTEHPEAQIPDGSITEQKLSSDVVATLNDVDNKADKVGSYPDLIAGTADNLLSSSYQTDRTPYILRRTPYGARERGSIVGGSIVWNQLCNNASVTVVNGHKYLLKKDGAYSIGASTGTALTGLTVGSDMVFDLTLMFGSTIADYIYTQEQATAGAGVALAKAWAGIKGYVPYDAGTLKSVSNVSAHKMVGFNQFDAANNTVTGNFVRAGNTSVESPIGSVVPNSEWNCSEYTRVFPNTRYTLTYAQYNKASAAGMVYYSDATVESAISGVPNVVQRGAVYTFITPADCSYIRFSWCSDSAHAPCLNLSWDGERDGEYEPYEEHSYPLDSDVTLRGIPKLDANNSLYYDGDIYKADGTVERKYGIVDLGTLTWSVGGASFASNTFSSQNIPTKAYGNVNFVANGYTATDSPYLEMQDKTIRGNATGNRVYIRDTAYTDAAAFKTAMSGVYLLYELAEPTTEQAEPYTELQICDPNGTEEWVGANMPVGHETKYYADLKGKIEDIPDAPSTNGTYVLKATVSSSGVTYEWIAG